MDKHTLDKAKAAAKTKRARGRALRTQHTLEEGSLTYAVGDLVDYCGRLAVITGFYLSSSERKCAYLYLLETGRHTRTVLSILIPL